MRFASLHHIDDLADHFLPFPHHECVNESVHRFGVETGVSARDDKRVRFAAIRRTQRDARQVKQVEGIGVEGFVGQRETDDVKSRQRMFGLQRVERKVSRPHELFHIHPGSIGTLGQGVRALVDQVVQDLHAEI